MELSIIIPVHSGLSLTQAMLASLRATLPAGLRHEIIVVDNASSDGTAEWLESACPPPLRVLRERTNTGYAAANNRGVRDATGMHVALLNNDLVLLPGWLEPMLEAVQRSDVDIAGNIQFSVRSREIDHAGVDFDRSGQPRHFRPSLRDLAGQDLIKAPAVTGACMLMRRSLFQELRGFDETYVNGYEDIDLCLRARKAGIRCAVAARSAAYHHIGSSEERKGHHDANAARFLAQWGEFARGLEPIELGPVDPGAARPPFDRDAFATLQAYHPVKEGIMEAHSTAHLYPTGRWTEVTVPLPAGMVGHGHTLRLDPCNFPGKVLVASFALRESRSGKLLWSASPGELARLLRPAGTASSHTEAGKGLAVESEGQDPQLLLESGLIPEELTRRHDLSVQLRLKTDLPGRPPGSIGAPAPIADPEPVEGVEEGGAARLETLSGPVRVAVDLTRLVRGGHNGGIKPFVFDFLRWISTERASQFSFVYLTQSSLVPEVEALRRDCDAQVCVAESEGCPPPKEEENRAGLVWVPGLSGEWMEKWPVDVLYAPLGPSPFRRPGLPWITLVADTLHRDRPEALPPEECAYRDQWMADCVGHADAIQCLSHFARRQLERHFAAPSAKVFVTYYAIPPPLAAAAAGAVPGPTSGRPYFLYPANDWPHKNHDALLVAYAAYRRAEGSAAWDLVLSGNATNLARLNERIESLHLGGACRHVGHLDPSAFIPLFRQAGALVFPSLYEGFGIPVLEAMSWGLPVACSNVASLPEVAGDAALYFDPADPAAIAGAMRRLSSDAVLRRCLVEAGQKRAADFSLKREASLLADRFLSLAAARRKYRT